MRLYDAHTHLQDDRFDGRQDELIADCAAVGLTRMGVNGTYEGDWPSVAALAKRHVAAANALPRYAPYVVALAAAPPRRPRSCGQLSRMRRSCTVRK